LRLLPVGVFLPALPAAVSAVLPSHNQKGDPAAGEEAAAGLRSGDRRVVFENI